AKKAGHDLSKMPVSAHSWGWLNQDKDRAIKEYFYPTKLLVDQISKERPHWTGMTYDQYLESVGENGAIFVGDSKTVANKIIKVMEELGLNRFYLHLPIASMPHEEVMNAIKIYGEEVVPKVKEHFKKKEDKKRLNVKCSDPRNSDTDFGGFLMTKLSKKDKMNIFKEWKYEGKGAKYLSKKYGVNVSRINYLLELIDRHGFTILDKFYTYHSKEFKEEAINRVLLADESINN